MTPRAMFNLPGQGLLGDADAQAREWFVRLRGDAISPEEIAEWEAWLRADPANGAAYDRVAEIWSLAAGPGIAAATAGELASDSYDGVVAVSVWRSQRRRRLQLVWGAAAAAAIAGLAVVGLEWRLSQQVLPVWQVTTVKAEHRDEALPDGSKIVLGGLTTLEVRFGREHRTVVLQSGEAMFNVAHDRARPFVVQTAFGSITAVGTAFDVDVGANAVVLSVGEGAVNVDPAALRQGTRAGAPFRVSAGQRLVIDAEGARFARVDPNSPGISGWMKGQLEYRGQPLELVLDDVNRYSDQPIRLADPQLRTLTYTGTVSLDRITPWALALGDAFPLAAERASDGAIVLTRKNPAP